MPVCCYVIINAHLLEPTKFILRFKVGASSPIDIL